MSIKGYLLKKDYYSALKNFIFFFLNCRKIIKTAILLLKQKEDLKELQNTLAEYDTLFITHAIGGGTGLFVKNFLTQNNKILFLTNEVSKISFLYVLKISDGKKFYIHKKDLHKVFTNNFSNIYINSLFEFPDWKNILNRLQNFKENFPESHIEYFVHDFHCVCPHKNLMYKNDFCNLNCSEYKCRFYKRVDFVNKISIWRDEWNKFLKNIDSIRCFSESSKSIVKTIYNDIEDKIKVIPHNMDYCNFTPIKDIEKIPFKCAIIGFIDDAAKGLYVTEYLMNRFSEKNLQLVFIGSDYQTFNGRINISGNHKYLGTYKHDDLQKILEEEEISIVAFPSVCPETFSYLVSELMQMNIPIIGFDLGAQGEKLKKYEKGYVVKNKEEMADKLIYLEEKNEF